MMTTPRVTRRTVLRQFAAAGLAAPFVARTHAAAGYARSPTPDATAVAPSLGRTCEIDTGACIH